MHRCQARGDSGICRGELRAMVWATRIKNHGLPHCECIIMAKEKMALL